MTQSKPETVTGFIEKLEALRVCFLELSANKTEKFVLYDDLRAIIEQEKSKISEGLKNSQAEQTEPIGEYEIVDGKFMAYPDKLKCEGIEYQSGFMYAAPQPTPLNVIDAERMLNKPSTKQ